VTYESITDTKFHLNRSRGLPILHCPVEVMHIDELISSFSYFYLRQLVAKLQLVETCWR